MIKDSDRTEKIEMCRNGMKMRNEQTDSNWALNISEERTNSIGGLIIQPIRETIIFAKFNIEFKRQTGFPSRNLFFAIKTVRHISGTDIVWNTHRRKQFQKGTEMRNQGLYNYVEINSYCKSEGVDTAYFIVQIENSGKAKQKRSRLMMLVAMLTKLVRN